MFCVVLVRVYFQCLVYNELPFAEDVRQFSFSSLPVNEADVDAKHVNKKLAPTGKINITTVALNYFSNVSQPI